jgi:hypothetical protein
VVALARRLLLSVVRAGWAGLLRFGYGSSPSEDELVGTYTYDQAWKDERERLAGIERLWDEGTFALLERLGVGLDRVSPRSARAAARSWSGSERAIASKQWAS